MNTDDRTRTPPHGDPLDAKWRTARRRVVVFFSGKDDPQRKLAAEIASRSPVPAAPIYRALLHHSADEVAAAIAAAASAGVDPSSFAVYLPGAATRRAMAGPEIPHNEAGVPIMPATVPRDGDVDVLWAAAKRENDALAVLLCWLRGSHPGVVDADDLRVFVAAEDTGKALADVLDELLTTKPTGSSLVVETQVEEPDPDRYPAGYHHQTEAEHLHYEALAEDAPGGKEMDTWVCRGCRCSWHNWRGQRKLTQCPNCKGSEIWDVEDAPGGPPHPLPSHIERAASQAYAAGHDDGASCGCGRFIEWDESRGVDAFRESLQRDAAEATTAAAAPGEIDLMDALVKGLKDTAERLNDKTEKCTGVAARWCPVHGDCSCMTDERGEHWGHPGVDEDGEDCPLHGESSRHAKKEDAP